MEIAMSIIVTLDMYSGRQNPSWELSEADAKKFLKMMSRRKEYQPPHLLVR
jgi:hypothetical protein